MQLSDFSYNLPNHLIARYPTAKRSDSRLLQIDPLKDGYFHQLMDLFEPGDLLIFNDSRVIPARLYGQKASGGKVEILLERIMPEGHALVHTKASKSPKVGGQLIFHDGTKATVVARHDHLFELDIHTSLPLLDYFQQTGEIPLPPYMERAPEASDYERYQTVYADRHGAVAAPTAGLHFDQALLQKLKEKGVNFGFLTLHVGAGTFLPVRVNDITQHKMHEEYIEVSAELCQQIINTQERGQRIVAVGTTTLRSLQSACKDGEIKPFKGYSDIFIYPGYKFTRIDGLITNFHLPESTLLMLVSAFGGYAKMMAAYHTAIEWNYRFYSYGDAMFIALDEQARRATTLSKEQRIDCAI